MNLRELAKHDNIYVQCHDNPDADAVASGFGLYRYFKDRGVKTRLFYSGRHRITKPNMLEMIRLLEIPVEYLPPDSTLPGLLITVDCQFGAGNVSAMKAVAVAVIDHHIQEHTPPPLHDIRPYLGSCSTLVWKLLTDDGFIPDKQLETALYYGLFMDTGGFAEIGHPLDRDLRDNADIDRSVIRVLKNSNLSLEDLSLAARALTSLEFNEAGRFALIETEPCDPNILGYVSDLVMQVHRVDIAVVFSPGEDGLKYSVRTVTREVKASDVAAWLAAGGLGSGGGHAEKAGGSISAHNYRKHTDKSPRAFFSERLSAYLTAYRIMDARTAGLDLKTMALYRKLPVRLTYVPCRELFPHVSTLNVRMLEGDITIRATADTYLMIGKKGEVYPIEKEVFEQSYRDEPGGLRLSFHYPPAVLDRDMGSRVTLESVARPCVRSGGGQVWARRLEEGIKLFTRWDRENYLKGEPGDWLVARQDDPGDLYIVTADMFDELYETV